MPRRCFTCGRVGHFSAACPQTYPEMIAIKMAHKTGGRAENDVESYCRRREADKSSRDEKRAREMAANASCLWACTCPAFRKSGGLAGNVRLGRDETIMPQFYLPGESQSCKHILGVQQGTADILEGEPYSERAKKRRQMWCVQGSGSNRYTVSHDPEEADDEEEQVLPPPPPAKVQKTADNVTSNATNSRPVETNERRPSPTPVDDDSDDDLDIVEDQSHLFERKPSVFDSTFSSSDDEDDQEEALRSADMSFTVSLTQPVAEADRPAHEWDLDALPKLSLHELKQRARLLGQNVTGRKADLLRTVAECVRKRKQVEASRAAAERERAQGLLRECPFCLQDVRTSEMAEHRGVCRARMLWSTGGRVPDHLKC